MNRLCFLKERARSRVDDSQKCLCASKVSRSISNPTPTSLFAKLDRRAICLRSIAHSRNTRASLSLYSGASSSKTPARCLYLTRTEASPSLSRRRSRTELYLALEGRSAYDLSPSRRRLTSLSRRPQPCLLCGPIAERPRLIARSEQSPGRIAAAHAGRA